MYETAKKEVQDFAGSERAGKALEFAGTVLAPIVLSGMFNTYTLYGDGKVISGAVSTTLSHLFFGAGVINVYRMLKHEVDQADEEYGAEVCAD